LFAGFQFPKPPGKGDVANMTSVYRAGLNSDVMNFLIPTTGELYLNNEEAY
jgi:hypothetical protein